jgi:hypothetical protein
MGCPAGSLPQSESVLRRVIHGLAFAVAVATGSGAPEAGPLAAGGLPFEGRPTRVLVDATRTSIYLGSVRLTLSPFRYQDGAFTADYAAKVIPFFFFNERGLISVEFPEDSLRRLQRGETVPFKGQARNHAGEERRIEGRAVPAGAGLARGKIKVRVHVGKIELIFNSTFRFEPVE